MTTKAGVHITTGSRNGYGKVASAVPAVVLTTTDGLDEAKGYGGGRVITIYRPLGIYPHADGPDLLRQGTGTPEQARALADSLWPAILSACQRKDADYYQLTNEIGGGSLGPTRALLAYETRLMELAEGEGLHLVVGNQAGGTPGDWQMWIDLFLPFLRRAGRGRHIYGRHAYGGIEPDGNGMLSRLDKDGHPIPADWNAGRPFLEAEALIEEGIGTPLVITEAGQNGGYQFPGIERFMADVAGYDAICRQYANIWGFCLWTFGDFESANIAPAAGALAGYIQGQGGASKPVWPTFGSDDWQLDLIEAADAFSTTNPDAALQKFIMARPPWKPYGKETWRTGPDGVERAVQVAIDWTSPTRPFPRRYAFAVVPHWGEVRWLDEVPAAVFAFTHWPTDTERVTQRFGARPEVYAQWGLPGHEGVDIAGSPGSLVRAVAAGTVYMTGWSNTYGNQVRIDHGGGYKTVYAHMARPADVREGQRVAGGQPLGEIGTTGNSTGIHLHLGLKIEGRPAPGYPSDIADPTPYLEPFGPTWPNGAALHDLTEYVFGDGRAFRLQYTWGGTGTHPIQTQRANGRVYVVKGGGQAEEMWADSQYIYRGTDTSEDHNRMYTYYTRVGDQLVYGAPWSRRFMGIGQAYTLNPYIIHRWKDSCAVRLEGWPSWELQVVARHDQWVSPSGVVVPDVLEIHWEQYEKYFFGRGYGLVGWDGTNIGFGQSYIIEKLPTGTVLERTPIPCGVQQ